MNLLRLGLLLVGVACASVSTHAADDLAISQRADEALMWQRKSRDDLAADIWRRILVLDPNHALALLNLGLIEARAGHPAEARALLLRAQHLKKPPLGLARLEAALADQPDVPPAPELLAEPAAEFRAGNSESRRSESTRRRRSEDAADAETTATASSSSRRSGRRASAAAASAADNASESPSATASSSAVYARERASSSASAPSSAAQPRFVAPAATTEATAYTPVPASTSASAGASTSARVVLRGSNDEGRSPAIPFPELASQLPMGASTSLDRPAVVPLEATAAGAVVRGKPRPTKPLPFLPPPV
jgi:cobalamin biosynthesis Mg chelatase CobN